MTVDLFGGMWKKNVINDEKETERSKIKIVAISPSFDGVRFSNVLK